MIPRALVTVLISGMVVAGSCNLGWSLEGQSRSVQGLWRLMGLMPAGVPAEEVPGELAEHVWYWFHDDGRLAVFNDRRNSATRNTGLWRQKGSKLTIVWKTGTRLILRVVRKTEDSLILTGFGLRPVWYRFTRVF